MKFLLYNRDMERVLSAAMGDTTVVAALTSLYALPFEQGPTVRCRRYLLDEAMDIEVPLRGDGAPQFVFAPFPEIGQAQAHLTRTALDSALHEADGQDRLPSLLHLHLEALAGPMVLPYWLIQLPGESGGFLTAVCLLSDLVRFEGERVYGMSNGWALHVYPSVRRFRVRTQPEVKLVLRTLA